MHRVRVILYHVQSTSARLRFLRFANHSICAFEPLPRLSMLIDDDPDAVAIHPSAAIRQVEEKLGITSDDLEVEAEYQARVDVANGPVNVLLARFTSIDPPFEVADKISAEFVELPQARDLPQVELELLRKAYELVIGG